MHVSLPYIEFFYGSLLYLFRIRVFFCHHGEIVQINRLYAVFLLFFFVFPILVHFLRRLSTYVYSVHFLRVLRNSTELKFLVVA